MTETGPNQIPVAGQTQAPAEAPVAGEKAAVFPPLPGPNFLARSRIPFVVVEYSLKGYHLDAAIPAENVVSAAAELSGEGFALDTITGVDWLVNSQMEVVYDYFHPVTGLRAVVRTRIPRKTPEISSIIAVFPGANWHERETHDFFGIAFLGHPNLAPFLLPEDATYHPLRKDYTP